VLDHCGWRASVSKRITQDRFERSAAGFVDRLELSLEPIAHGHELVNRIRFLRPAFHGRQMIWKAV
jgi:hypothetical protein